MGDRDRHGPITNRPDARRPAAPDVPGNPGDERPAPDGLPRRRGGAAPTEGEAGSLAVRGAVASPSAADPLALARRVVELAEDKKAADIVLLDLRELTSLADFFVICSGGSERQLEAIADGVVEGLHREGLPLQGREGRAASHWILLDYGTVVVHIFAPLERDYYQLERHWAAARVVLRVQ